MRRPAKGASRGDASASLVDAWWATVLAGDVSQPHPILEQTLISAFPSRDAAQFARDFVIRHSRVVPTQNEIVDRNHSDRLRALIPDDLHRDACKALDGGHALLILKVDETDAFRVRELLEEDTRSEWTMAAPPQVIASIRHQSTHG